MAPKSDRRLSAWILTLAALLMAACGPAVPPPDRVAEIDGEALSHATFESFLRRNAVEGSGALGSDVLSSLLDQFLDERLLSRLAVDRLGLTAEVDSQSAVRSLLEEGETGVSDEAVADYYRRHVEQFDQPARIYLRQILFSDRATAERIRRLWSQGQGYASVVTAVADDESAHIGEEGLFTREQLPPVFAEPLFDLSDGEVSQVIPVEYGLHVFQVVRRVESGIAPLEDVAEQIRRTLLARRREDRLSQLAAEARERYNVRVFERNLPFNYGGRYRSSEDHEDS